MTSRSALAALPFTLFGIVGCSLTLPPATDPLPDPSGHFEVVGRGPVTQTHTSGLWVFQGVDGRDYAYTGTWGQCPGCYGDRVYVWDVTDGANPVLTDSVMVDARIVSEVKVNAAGTLGVVTRQGGESRRDGIVILDLAEPAHPRIAADYWETLTGGVRSVSIDGNYVYAVHSGTDDMHVIDISDPTDPVQIGRWGVPAHPQKHLRTVSVADGLAFLAYWDDGLIIVDVGNGVREGNPGNPQYVSQYRYRHEIQGRDYTNTNTAFPYVNSAGNRYVFVGDEIFPSDFDIRRLQSVPAGHVRVLDIGNVLNPVEVGQYRIPRAGVHRVWAEDDVLYVAYFNAGLRAVDISGSVRGDLGQQRREIGAIATTDADAFIDDRPFTWAAMPHKGLVFATDHTSGLWIARLVRDSALD